MPKFTFENFGKALSLFGDLFTVAFIVYKSKSMTICNPAVSILFYSSLLTVLFFLCPFLYGKMTTKNEKIMMVIIMLLFSMGIVFTWIKISDNSNCLLPKKPIIINHTRNKPVDGINDLPKPKTRNSVSNKKVPLHAIGFSYEKTKSIKLKTDKFSKTKDTSKSISKYDLSHATVDHSAVGDNAHVDNYNGIKQRNLTEATILSILNQLPKDKKVRISFTQTAVGDKELLNYATQIANSLNNHGYSNLNMAINTAFAVPIKFGEIEVINSTDGSTIVVHPQSNTQQ